MKEDCKRPKSGNVCLKRTVEPNCGKTAGIGPKVRENCGNRPRSAGNLRESHPKCGNFAREILQTVPCQSHRVSIANLQFLISFRSLSATSCIFLFWGSLFLQVVLLPSCKFQPKQFQALRWSPKCVFKVVEHWRQYRDTLAQDSARENSTMRLFWLCANHQNFQF